LPKLRVDRENGLVVFGEIGYFVGEVAAAIFQVLIDAQGKWISPLKMQGSDAILESVRIPRIINKLPPILHELVESEKGKGFRLKTELLA
jgi:hypothetical protein